MRNTHILFHEATCEQIQGPLALYTALWAHHTTLHRITATRAALHLNDKGLVTAPALKATSDYLYQAAWSEAHVRYINSRRFTPRGRRIPSG